MTILKRSSWSPAYIDGSHVSVYITIGLLVALGFAVILRDVINPLWLGVAVAGVFLYQLAIFWLMRQFSDVARVFITLIFGVISLGLAASLVVYISGVKLPTDLPIVMYLNGFYPFHTSTYDPSAVAIFYGSFAHIVALTVTMPFWFLGQTKSLFGNISVPFFKKVDLFADVYLDRLSFYLDSHSYSWVVALVGAIAAIIAIVVGSAVLFL